MNDEAIEINMPDNTPLNIAVLYDTGSIHVNTIKEYLDSFSIYSKHTIYYIPATQDLVCKTDLSQFDAVVIHYSVRVSMLSSASTFSASYAEAIREYTGYKILFIQDEYEGTNHAKYWIHHLGIHCVYTCVPQDFIEFVYPAVEFTSVKFITILTGFIPLNLDYTRYQPTIERAIMIGYRGRKLPYWYGSLGEEKYQIGVKTKKLCSDLNIDIELKSSKRIYGQAWYDFIGTCRAMLGTESGSNVFDFDGAIRLKIEAYLLKNKKASFSEIYTSLISPYEKIKMNQVSPKIFEAISLKTALILFEGEYSGIIKPNIHYIPLKKDFSNFKEVISALKDDEFIERITTTAYHDVIESSLYSYERFISDFDAFVSSQVKKKQHHKLPGYVFFIPQELISNFEEACGDFLAFPSNKSFSTNQVKKMDCKLAHRKSFLFYLINLPEVSALFLVKIYQKIPESLQGKIKFLLPNFILSRVKKALNYLH